LGWGWVWGLKFNEKNPDDDDATDGVTATYARASLNNDLRCLKLTENRQAGFFLIRDIKF